MYIMSSEMFSGLLVAEKINDSPAVPLTLDVQF